jgi:hypothetical protein
MKKLFMLTLFGLCLFSSNGMAGDTTTTSGIVQDTTKRVETPVRLKAGPMAHMGPSDGAGGGMYFGGGIYNQSFKNLNTVLTRNGFNTLDQNMTMFSCGFFGLATPYSRFGLDFEYIWSDPASAVADSSPFVSVNGHGFNIGMKGGFDVLKRPKWSLMPVYGVGYYSHTYDFKPRSTNFDDIFNGNIKDAVKLRYSGLSLTLGLNVSLKTKFDKDTKENGKLHEPMAGLNMEGGVHFYPKRNMKVGDLDIDNGPSMSRYGVYGKLYIDLGEKISLLPGKDKE